MELRREIYEKLCDRLMAVKGVKHVDLWNHNVEFIEQEESWARPAVFVEFQPIQWDATVNGVRYVAAVTVNLHVVTDWKGSTAAGSIVGRAALDVFDLLERIHVALADLDGEMFKEFDLVGSTTTHNHEDILEMVETYSCVGYREIVDE